MIELMELLPVSFFEGGAVTVAPTLLGKIIRKAECAGVIVEVEAYAGDPASHAFRLRNQGRLTRETYGRWYVYFTYGMHYCANMTCDKAGMGGILIRAVKPIHGLELMRQRRQVENLYRLCSGPGRVAQAFGIGKSDNGSPLTEEFGIFDAPPIAEHSIAASGRIGLSQATDLPWRFYVKDSRFVSKPSPRSRDQGKAAPVEGVNRSAG